MNHRIQTGLLLLTTALLLGCSQQEDISGELDRKITEVSDSTLTLEDQVALLRAELDAFKHLGPNPGAVAERLLKLEAMNSNLRGIAAMQDLPASEQQSEVSELKNKLRESELKLDALVQRTNKNKSSSDELQAALSKANQRYEKAEDELKALKEQSEKLTGELVSEREKNESLKSAHARALTSAAAKLEKDKAVSRGHDNRVILLEQSLLTVRQEKNQLLVQLENAIAERDEARLNYRRANAAITASDSLAIAAEGRTLALLAKMDAEFSTGGSKVADSRRLSSYIEIRKAFRTGQISLSEFEARSRAAALAD